VEGTQITMKRCILHNIKFTCAVTAEPSIDQTEQQDHVKEKKKYTIHYGALCYKPEGRGFDTRRGDFFKST
jgi:hypothetical protein